MVFRKKAPFIIHLLLTLKFMEEKLRDDVFFVILLFSFEFSLESSSLCDEIVSKSIENR